MAKGPLRGSCSAPYPSPGRRVDWRLRAAILPTRAPVIGARWYRRAHTRRATRRSGRRASIAELFDPMHALELGWSRGSLLLGPAFGVVARPEQTRSTAGSKTVSLAERARPRRRRLRRRARGFVTIKNRGALGSTRMHTGKKVAAVSITWEPTRRAPCCDVRHHLRFHPARQPSVQ